MAPEARLEVSLVIPTFNRVDRLSQLLQDLSGQQADGLPYEVLVVDNGSTDATAKAVKLHAARDPRVRYLLERRFRGRGRQACRSLPHR